jgi:hypothetical protein
MPLGRYVEKYELNGKSSQSYGSITSCDAESQVMLPKNVSLNLLSLIQITEARIASRKIYKYTFLVKLQ